MFDVTFVLPGLVPAGGVRAVFEISDHLLATGRQTHIVVPKRSLLPNGRGVAAQAARLAPRPFGPAAQRLAPRRAIAQDWFPLQTPLSGAGIPLWRDVPPSRVVVATSWRTAEEILRSREVASRAVYFLQHHETWSGPARRVDATWEALERMVVSSEWLRSMAVERFGKRDVRLAVYGYDPATFSPRPGPEPGSGPGSGTGFGEGPDRIADADRDVPVVGFMSDDRKWKGGADILASLERIRATRRIEVRTFGLGRSVLPSWVRSAGVLSGQALADFYRSLDVFVSGSWEESGPMTVPEAMACGVPVVSTDVGNVRLWSQDGAACRIVAPRDVQGLTTAIEGLLADPGEARRLGATGVTAIAPFTWESMARSFDEALVAFGLLEPLA